MVIGARPWVTGAAGILALLIGLLNTKDYFLFHKGPSLAISGHGKSSLFRRMRGLLNADRLPVMLAGTVVLALAANSYELLCTAGFPMVYTRVLTLEALPTLQYYAYLALYNVVYVLPLLVIVLLFAMSMGRRKLGEQEGRTLKLLSGLMMLALGGVLVIAPELLVQLWVGASLLLGAIILTWVIQRIGFRSLIDRM